MSREDEQYLNLGRMVATMIVEIKQRVPSGDVGFARRSVTFPGGEVVLFVVSETELADRMEKGAETGYDMVDMPPIKIQ